MTDPEQRWQLGRRIQIRASVGLIIPQAIAWLNFFFISQQPGFHLTTIGVVITVLLAAYAIYWVIPIARSARGVTIALVVSLSNAFLLLVVAFAGLYYRFGMTNNFAAPMETHIDALYFTLGILTTAGTGNISPVGQLSRGLVGIQMFIDLVFITIAVSIAVTRLAERRSSPPRE